MQPQENMSPKSVHRLTPAVDVLESKDGYLIRADVPGVAQDGFTVNFEKNTLALEGRFDQGRNTFAWARSFVLPGGVDADKISAELKDGVLSVTLPKQERLKPRQINIRMA